MLIKLGEQIQTFKSTTVTSTEKHENVERRWKFCKWLRPQGYGTLLVRCPSEVRLGAVRSYRPDNHTTVVRRNIVNIKCTIEARLAIKGGSTQHTALKSQSKAVARRA